MKKQNTYTADNAGQEAGGSLFSIGDVAKMFHISPGSLRHYEKLGLLAPEYIDEATGYRYYSVRQFECLNTIRYLRVLDMPLEQIADFLQNRDVGKMQEMLLGQKEAVRKKCQELADIEKKIDNRLRQLSDARSSDLEAIELKQIPPCRISWIQNELSLHSWLDLETSIREIDKNQKDAVVFLGKVGVGITKERLEKGEYDRYDRVFLLLDTEDHFEGKVEELPAQTCAVLRFCGGHKEAPAYYERLAAFLKEEKLVIDGFSREITLIDYGLTNDTEQFVTEIQIPVRRG